MPILQYNVHFEGIIVIGTRLCEVGARQLSICSPQAANGQLEGPELTQSVPMTIIHKKGMILLLAVIQKQQVFFEH